MNELIKRINKAFPHSLIETVRMTEEHLRTISHFEKMRPFINEIILQDTLPRALDLPSLAMSAFSQFEKESQTLAKALPNKLLTNPDLPSLAMSAFSQFEKESIRISELIKHGNLLRTLDISSSITSIISQIEEVSRNCMSVIDDQNLRYISHLSSNLSQLENISPTRDYFHNNSDSSRWALENHLQNGLSKFIKNYEGLIINFNRSSDLTDLTNLAFFEPSRELLTASVTFNSFSKRPAKLERNIVETTFTKQTHIEVKESRELLRKFDLDLSLMLDGAVHACKTGGADSCRHVLASLRELLDHLIRSLAPDDAVISWTTNPSYFYKGRPTRGARINYICRNVTFPHFASFLLSDTREILKFFELLQKLHEKIPPFTKEQTENLILRAQSYILFLLRIPQ